MTYWIPTGDRNRDYEFRISCETIKDAYRDGAKPLLGLYRRTNGNIHKLIDGYNGSTGLPIYNSANGKACNHWVRFANGSNPKDGYEEVVYDRRYGISYKSKDFPKNWM